jgi:DUF1365 family protein
LDKSTVLQLCQATVMHQRLRPFKHPFVYRLFCLRLRIDDAQALATQSNWLFGVNRRRLVSFMNADHGARDGQDLMPWLKETLARVNVSLPGGAVWLQCFPRMLGYVFNPVSFWFLHDEQGGLRVILAEVNNTFGQHHHYVLTHHVPSTAEVSGPADIIQSGDELFCQKVFHVSPFCPVRGHYRFRYDAIDEQAARPAAARITPSAPVASPVTRIRMAIDYFDDSSLAEPLIQTAITAHAQPFRSRALLGWLLRMPWMTFAVMVRIHWHAFKLWLRRAPFHRLPDLPTHDVTTNQRLPE